MEDRYFERNEKGRTTFSARFEMGWNNSTAFLCLESSKIRAEKKKKRTKTGRFFFFSSLGSRNPTERILFSLAPTQGVLWVTPTGCLRNPSAASQQRNFILEIVFRDNDRPFVADSVATTTATGCFFSLEHAFTGVYTSGVEAKGPCCILIRRGGGGGRLEYGLRK